MRAYSQNVKLLEQAKTIFARLQEGRLDHALFTPTAIRTSRLK
jgi:hypothetical protein